MPDHLQTAVRYMGLKDPAGKTVKWGDKAFQVVGVIKDMIMESPFKPVTQTVYHLNYDWANVINIKLNPARSTSESLVAIEGVFRKFNPGSHFDYRFTDQQYALKFAAEERIGKLVSGFAVLVTLLTVSFQSIRAALVNPVKSLRSE